MEKNFSVKNWKKKINFINLFGYEEKIIFYDFTSGKIEEMGENKFYKFI